MAQRRPIMNRIKSSFGYSSASSASSDNEDEVVVPSSTILNGGGDNGHNGASTSGTNTPPTSDDEAAYSSSNEGSTKKLPQCWGHRGASAAFPENTLASFEQAIKDGAEGIESDVHVSLDGEIIMFHDAYLNRTTNGKGLISKQAYRNGIDKLRTTKLPAQSICTFAETLALLMQPDSKHVQLNIDVKLDNDPEILYKLMHAQIVQFPNWSTELAPRLVLGLWHAKYIEPAQRILPYCKLAHIGVSPSIARKHFWNACSAFSLNYATLVGKEGAEFRRDCAKEGKELYVWTVNDRQQMIQAVMWGASVILTDKTADYLRLRNEMSKDFTTVSKEVDSAHPWSNLYFYTPINEVYKAWWSLVMHRSAGPMPRAAAAKKPTHAVAQASTSDTSV